MVRAIVRNGMIEPLVPLPADWTDGRELVIAEAPEPTVEESELDAWAADVEAAMGEIPPEDYDRFEAAIAEHKKEAKEYMRRRWGLA